MGRGRAKAKQTKVARRLKYTTTGTDLERLREELVGNGGTPEHLDHASEPADDALEDDDPYAAYADDDFDDENEATDRAG